MVDAVFGQLQVLNGDFPPFQQIPVKQHFVQVSVLWQPGPPPRAAKEAGWEWVVLWGSFRPREGGGGNGPQQEEVEGMQSPTSPVASRRKGHQLTVTSPHRSPLKGSCPSGDQRRGPR